MRVYTRKSKRSPPTKRYDNIFAFFAKIGLAIFAQTLTSYV